MASKSNLRSISFPSRSHPSVASVEEQLNKLKSLEVSSAPSNSNSLCIALTMVEDLYERVDSLLNMASTQQVLSNYNQHTDTLLEASVRLLDACSMTRDVLLQTNEHVRELQSALRRRRNKGDSSLEVCFSSYISFRKKTKKDIKKFVSTLKQVENKFQHINVDENEHLYAVMTALRHVCAMSVFVFQTLLSFLAVSDRSKHKSSSRTRWSTVMSKFVHKGVIACEDHEKLQLQYSCVNEFQSVDSLVNINVVSSEIDAQRRLKALENSVDGLESGLESVFRRLIRTRASLLNIISH